MPKNELPPLANLLHAFFYDWLEEQRDASRCTVIAYRDAWRLFLRFVAGRHKRPVAALQFDHLSQSEVLAFLHHLEHERHASITTRNCRLAALRSFFSFVADREPLAVRQCADILRIPFKRAPVPAMRYLEPVEATALLEEPDRSTPKGRRDHALLSLLYNTGARIQEVLSLRPQDICLKPLPYVRLMGKECHSYCISLRPRYGTTGKHTGQQACDLAFSLADVLPVVRKGIGLGRYRGAHGASRVEPMSEPYPA